MYTAYGDESADATKQKVFTLAGLFGNASDWDMFRETWRSRTGGKIFHAADCDSDGGDYKETSHKENKKLYADLTQIIANSNLIGHTATIDIIEYKNIIADRLHEEPYFFAFNSVVINLAKRARLCIPQDRIEFIFDR